MNLKRSMSMAPVLRAGAVAILVAALAACSGTPKPKPQPLPPNVALMGIKQAWALKLSPVTFALVPGVSGDHIALASADGTVVMFDARAGTELWRASVGAPLAAGAGTDGSTIGVVTTNGEVVALQGGKVLWKQRLTAQSYTPPLVAGRRIFVQAADRTTSAWDGQSGRRLWSQQRPAENLVLKKPGVLMAIGDTLVVGIGGRLVGMSPANGSSRWESPIAAPRGTNDVERLVDLTGTVSRIGDNVCARAYFASVGCVDTARGQLVWTKPAVGADGVGGDERFVYGTEDSGAVIAWRRADGSQAWQQADMLKYRNLTGPLAVGRALVFGDDAGTVYLLSSEDGKALNRITPDGSAIVSTPVLAGNTVVVVTRNGGVFGYRPE